MTFSLIDGSFQGFGMRFKDQVGSQSDLRVAGGVERVTLECDVNPVTKALTPRHKRITLSGPWAYYIQATNGGFNTASVPGDNVAVPSQRVPCQIGTNVANSTLTINWRGTSLIAICPRDSIRGQFMVANDGGGPSTIDLYSAVSAYGVPTVLASGLAFGDHTTVITVTGNKNGSATDANVGFYGFDVITTTDATLQYAAGSAFPAGQLTTVGAGSLTGLPVIGTGLYQRGLVYLNKAGTVGIQWGTAGASADSLATFQANNAVAYRVEAEDTTGKLANVWWTAFSSGGLVSAASGSYRQALGTTTTATDASSTDYVVIGFIGTGIDLLYTKYSGGGQFAYSIDGGSETTVDSYNPITQEQSRISAASLYNLAYGYHQLKVRKLGTKNASSSTTAVYVDAFDIYLPKTPALPVNAMSLAEVDLTPSVGWMRYGSAAGWVYSGANWGTASDARCTGGSIRSNANTNTTDTATFTFTGTQFRLWANIGPSGSGQFNVKVDGGANTLVDPYSATSAIAVVYTSPALSAGTHTVIITTANTKNASAANNIFYLDSIEVLPLPVQVRDVRNVYAQDTTPIDQKIADHKNNERHPANIAVYSLGDTATTSTTSIQIGAAYTFTTKGGTLRARFIGQCQHSVASGIVAPLLNIDGTDGSENPMVCPAASARFTAVAEQVLAVPAGTHTVILKGRVATAGTGTFNGQIIIDEV